MLTSVNSDRRLDNKIKNGEETLTETLVVDNAYALSQFFFIYTASKLVWLRVATTNSLCRKSSMAEKYMKIRKR